MKNRHYKLSKFIVAAIVVISPPIDMAVGYFFGTEQWPQFAVSLSLTIALGVVYYFTYMWQIEQLSKGGRDAAD